MERFAAALHGILAGPRPSVVPLGEGRYRVRVEIAAPEKVTGEQVVAVQRAAEPGWRWHTCSVPGRPLVLAYEVSA